MLYKRMLMAGLKNKRPEAPVLIPHTRNGHVETLLKDLTSVFWRLIQEEE